MAEAKTVFHAGPYSMCYTTHVEEAFPGKDVTHPEHGEVVMCGMCRRLGVIPEPGHELEFCAPGTERTPDGGFIFRPPAT